jgi:hypothetical protein
MFKRDYIMRMIEQLGVAYQAILGLKTAKRYDDAERLISKTSQQLLGFDMDLLRSLSDEAIISLLKRPDSADVTAYVVAAELLREQGEIDVIRRGPDAGYDCFVKAASLYLEAYLSAPQSCPEDAHAKIAFLTSKLSGFLVPEPTRRKLFMYYEIRGDYAQAENVIFHLAEGAAEDAPAMGKAFYARLQAKSDEELERGGLPREEMEEGFEAFRELTTRR